MAQWINSGITMPLPLANYASAEHEGKIYIIGGVNVSTGLALSTVYILDLSAKTWSTGATLPVPLWDHRACAVGGKVFVLGGGMHNPGYAANLNYYVYQYNIAANSWTRTITIPVNYGPGVTAHGENIYVLGGYATWTAAPSSTAVYYFSASNPTQYYTLNAAVPQFSNLTTMSSQTYGNKIFSVSGSEMIQLDLETLEVTTLAGPPVYKSAPGTALYHSEIWSANLGPSNEVDVYDILTGQWRTETYSTAPYAASGIAAYADNLYWLPYATSAGTKYIYTYGMASVSIFNASPSSGFVNERENNTFTWSLMSLPATRQARATFQWREGVSGQIHNLTVEGENTAITVPAGTFPDGSFQWRVMAEGQNGAVSAYTDWMTLVTVDEKPGKPTGLYPASGSRDGTRTIQFSWLHNSPLSTPQSAFELQVTYDGGTTWESISGKVISATTQFTAAAGTITPTEATGRVGWRVRTYNSDDVSSDWSDTAFFVVHPSPQAPNWISVESGRARPLCRWTSLGQIGFQLQILSGTSVLFDSGEIYSTQTEYRIPTILPNGVFIFALRIKNARGLFSEWANLSVLISASSRLSIVLNGQPVENGALLTFQVGGGEGE